MKNLMYIPNAIQIEFTEGCDRHCEFCGVQGMQIDKFNFLENATMTKFIQEIKRLGWNPLILLAGHGEPSLHPQCLDLIRQLRTELPKIRITMMSNGYAIKKDVSFISKLFDAGLTTLSLDEYLDNPLEDYVIPYLKHNNIPYDTSTKANLFGTKKQVYINQPLELYHTSVTRKFVNHCGAGKEPLTAPLDKRCARVFREMLIRSNGNVAICCNDFRGEFPIGNIMDMPLDMLWMHPRFEAARKMLYAGNRNFLPCNKCNALSVRVGLLPDRMGKETMPAPTEEDIKLVNQTMTPYSKIKKREWEK